MRFFCSVFEYAWLAFLSLSFLAMGSDTPEQYRLRLVFAGTLAVLSPVYLFLKKEKPRLSAALVCFGLFLGYEVLRAAAAAWLGFVKADVSFSLRHAFYAPLRWGMDFFILAMASVMAGTREGVRRHAVFFAWAAFLISVNAAVAILLHGKPFYPGAFGKDIFFPPVLYETVPFSAYFLVKAVHLNYGGDILAAGFFPALALGFYGLRKSSHGEKTSGPAASLLYFFLALTIAGAVFFMFSRGTMASFILAFLLWGILMMRYSAKAAGIFFAAFTGAALLFLASTGYLQKSAAELGTLKSERADVASSSLATNAEGAKRAARIFKDYPWFGIGTAAYRQFAPLYASPGINRVKLDWASQESMCFYLQTAAEEGAAGAFLYALFLAAYAAQGVIGIWRMKSRFQLLMLAAFFAFTLMLLGHAVISELLSRYAASALFYAFAGLALGIASSPETVKVTGPSAHSRIR